MAEGPTAVVSHASTGHRPDGYLTLDGLQDVLSRNPVHPGTVYTRCVGQR